MGFRYKQACVFCDILQQRAPFELVADLTHSLAIVPLNPVTPGHVIFISRVHVPDAYEFPAVTSDVMMDAMIWARLAGPESANIITSVGESATQTVFHLHIHVVPRVSGDGLQLPWSPR